MRFKEWLENKVIPLGHCYEWAWRYMKTHPDATLVHGRVTQPFSQPSEINNHAWIEDGDMVYDWQCMEGGCGGKHCGKGYPKATFYELFKPEIHKRYDQIQAMIAAARAVAKGGISQYGPFAD